MVVVRTIFKQCPVPHVDLFALGKNHKLPVFLSTGLSLTTSGINALEAELGRIIWVRVPRNPSDPEGDKEATPAATARSYTAANSSNSISGYILAQPTLISSAS